MDEFKKEIIVYSVVSGVCRCCLQDYDCNNFLGLWDQHLYEGNVEVYGDMIITCFMMPWSRPDNPETNVDQICGNCVVKVRDAFNFKKQLLTIEEHLALQFDRVKYEKEDNKSRTNVEVHNDNKNHLELSKLECQENQQLEECGPDYKIDSNNEDQPLHNTENVTELLENSDQEYEDVEYIEEDISETENDISLSKPEQQPQEIKRKWPKKIRKKKGEKIRSYRNYSQKDMRMAVRCALEGTMKHSEAAAKYGVPKKTVDAIVRKYKSQPLDESTLEPIEDISRVRMKRFINEIMTVLTYTNATPYKTTTSSYGCVYCNFVLKATVFEDPEELRAHTRVEHANERLQAVENFMRPYTSNEILKIDIYNLVCTVCCEAISGWMEMFEHLKQAHDVVLDEAYTRLIPYVLDVSSCKCAICKEKFNNYHHLDTHINCHYNNYVCADCGDTFLSQTRLKKHIQVHNTGRFYCDFPKCGKVFTLEKYKKKHYMLVHTNEKRVQCQYCNLKFHDDVQKHNHIKECHREKVTYTTCDICGVVFDWKPNYYAHMRKKHRNDHSMKCKYCDVLCISKIALKKHVKIHSDLTNRCHICNKTYSSQMYLKQHNWKVHETVMNSLVEIQSITQEESISSD